MSVARYGKNASWHNFTNSVWCDPVNFWQKNAILFFFFIALLSFFLSFFKSVWIYAAKSSPEIIFDGGIKFPHKSFISFHTDWKKVLYHGYPPTFPIYHNYHNLSKLITI